MIKNLIKFKILSITIMLFGVSQIFAQQAITFNYTTYGLESDQYNVIQNAGHMENFFESLYQQKVSPDKKINIVHIGDSHIQGDYMTCIVRRNLQKNFGNAGRGLVFPLKVAGTNEPFNIRSSSDVKWEVKRAVSPDLPLPIGIAGITIRTEKENANLQLIMKDPVMDFSFSRLTLFFETGAHAFDIVLSDTMDHLLDTIVGDSDPLQPHKTITLAQSIPAVNLQTKKTSDKQKSATIFGINVENGRGGILYHSIGVNGARYEHYNAATEFSRQTSALSPELFIISLGTNEAINFPYLDRNFYQTIDKLVTSLQERNPSAQFLFVTPPDAFRKKIQKNPGVSAIRNIIVQYAVENGYAFYDMYQALGGDGSASKWKQAGLLRNDGIHFTRQGYEYQGDLFFSALMKSYNQYVPLRHP